ncbi:MAG: alkaline phosphatase family protein [Spirochaetaceae bacterium]|nr:MAG: alkaline phosphatase family protein [Spirochaetaceae bacterium]
MPRLDVRALIRGELQERKIVWLILDAAGYEITTRCIQAGVCPSLARIQEQGYFGPSRPPEPNCETPPALRALFSGSEPAESGIWGYQMPDYAGRLERPVSGFEVPISGAAPIWEEMERRGKSYTLFNAAFRRDPVWGKGYTGYDLLLDGYRHYRPDWSWARIGTGPLKQKIGGAAIVIDSEDDSVSLRRGRRTIATLAPGEIRSIQLNRRSSALGYSTGKILYLSSSCRPHIRLSKDLPEGPSALVPQFVHHGSLFRYSRMNQGLSIDEELRLSEYASRQMAELALNAVRQISSTLTVLYFSLIDELCHVYLDQIEGLWPEGRAAELLRRCYRLIDRYVGEIMDCINSHTLLVLSADHGQAPYRRALYLNDLLVEAGLVRLGKRGYDLRRSVAYYHPANCGQVVVNPGQAKKAGLSGEKIGERVLRCVEQANSSLGSEIAHLWGGENDPYLLFLYPRGDTHLTGRHHPKTAVLDTNLKGGQHLSPLCPTPWMQAMLGLWSPDGLPFDRRSIPKRNTEMKDFLLTYLDET